MLAPDDIVVSDVGAHKIWVARLYQAYEPNTVIISNGFASMGIALPGAIAAALVHPDRHVVALCGDGGLLMNVQELETAVRLGVRVTVVVWRDDGYGLIDWKQRNEFGRPFGVEFGNPDFVALAAVVRDGRRSARRRRPTCAPTLARALDVDGPSLVEVPIDYRENLRLTEHLGALAWPDGRRWAAHAPSSAASGVGAEDRLDRAAAQDSRRSRPTSARRRRASAGPRPRPCGRCPRRTAPR